MLIHVFNIIEHFVCVCNFEMVFPIPLTLSPIPSTLSLYIMHYYYYYIALLKSVMDACHSQCREPLFNESTNKNIDKCFQP